VQCANLFLDAQRVQMVMDGLYAIIPHNGHDRGTFDLRLMISEK
jgi:hypothetical protein